MTASAPPANPAPPQVLLAHHLRQLKLPTFLREYEKVAAEAAREGLDHIRFLFRLAELELIDRERRMVERRIRAARFPAVKSFDTFDVTAIPSLNKMLTLELARCEYVLRHDNIIAIGNSGTGKTHTALALGLAACQHGSFFRLGEPGPDLPFVRSQERERIAMAALYDQFGLGRGHVGIGSWPLLLQECVVQEYDQ